VDSVFLTEGACLNIYVGNISLDMTDDELRKEFSAFGEVESVVMMNDKYIGSHQPRGYGYIEMKSKDEGSAAIAGLNGKSFRNRPVDVVEALPLSDKRHIESSIIPRKYRSNRSREREHQTT
jgi:RNA recognition motif-containing protein